MNHKGNSTSSSPPASHQWDLSTQTPHGGQEWRDLNNFLGDFSVTTNPFGAPTLAKLAAFETPRLLESYPAADYEPARTNLCKFILQGYQINHEELESPISNPSKMSTEMFESSLKDLSSRILLGNGASELIDLCVRNCEGHSWKPGPFSIQYQEYHRATTSNNYHTLPSDDDTADLLCIVNPCNPTGEFMDIDKIKSYIQDSCKNNSSVIIDESMIVFYGADWRNHSLANQSDWINHMACTHNISIYIIHSWTKIWACPGLRIGSLIAPTIEKAHLLRYKQVPWSMNSIAVAFLAEVVLDTEYLSRTWEAIPIYRQEMIKAISTLKPDWDFLGESFMPFIWINTKNETEAQFYYDVCKSNGVPIRWGGHGYGHPEYIRIGLKEKKKTISLIKCFEQAIPSCK